MLLNITSTIRLGILCGVLLSLTSCTFFLPVTITGRILDFYRLNQQELRITFEDIYALDNSITPDSVTIDDDGIFFISHKFRNILPQSLTVREGTKIVARLVIRKESGMVEFRDPVGNSTQEFEYNGTGTTEISGLRITPRFDSTELALLNVDRLLDRLEYSDREILVHFSSRPPTGSSLYLWGGFSEHFIDTTIAISDTVVRLDSRFFRDAELQQNLFSGGRFMNPYGWFQPFAAYDFIGHPDHHD